ncbi:MAG: Gfo/Idh/MocA family oxidoreductase [Phycisphaerae bacterium]|jgi:predicted dehydrogenase|nr:Gfo/Idh/MocA family oxidoreductase [Phycisphaerae bacterium]
MDQKHRNGVSRREFMTTAVAAAGTIAIVPSHVLGAKKGSTPPSDTVNVAQIGCGGKGSSDCRYAEQAGGKIVALCDVDSRRASRTFKAYDKRAKIFKDFRKLFEKMGSDIDAVIVSTPDHMHARISLQAMQMGKGVYCQKPLTRTVAEARLMTQTAAKYKVATQMGIQGHSSGRHQSTGDFIRAGAIGTVREVHIWTDRSVKWWPQGMGAPAGKQTVPNGLDWDLWLGVAPQRDYHGSYLPFVWRGWVGFGTGALGDIGCHALDSPFVALGLGAPTSVKASCSEFNKISFPKWSIVEYKFPAVGDRPAVKLFWYDGGKRPPRPEELESGRKWGNNGKLYIGDKGKMLDGQIIPEAKRRAFGKPPIVLPRPGGHYSDWINACKGARKDGKPIVGGANFAYSGPLAEAVLAGNAALYYPGQELKWDSKKMTFSNKPEADVLLTSEYREGWKL